MAKKNLNFQHEALKAFWDNKNDGALIELSEDEVVKTMQLNRLQRYGVIHETSADLKKRFKKNRGHVLQLARCSNTPIFLARNGNFIDYYIMFYKLELTDEDKKRVYELGLRESDFYQSKVQIATNSLNRFNKTLLELGMPKDKLELSE